MPEGIRDLRMMEIGFQVDCATAATPTDRIVGSCGLKKVVNRHFPTEATGLMADHIIDRYYDPWIMAEIPISPGDEGVTFQQLPWFLSMCARGGVVPTGGPLVYTWTFCPAHTAKDEPRPATIRYGDNVRVWESACCIGRNLVLSSAYQGPWMLDADIIGRDADPTAVFVGLPYPTSLDTILGQMTELYIEEACLDLFDSPSQKACTLIDWNLTLPGFHPKFFQDGELYYCDYGLASRHMVLEGRIEFAAAVAEVEWDAWMAGTPRYVRLFAEGPVIPGDSGTNYSATINMVLMYESFDTLDERDGNNIIKFVARTVYDVGCSDCEEWCFVVVNDQDALP